MDFGTFTRRGLLGDCAPCRNLEGTEQREGRGGKTKKEVVEYREATNLSEM